MLVRNISSEHGEPGTRVRVWEASAALPRGTHEVGRGRREPQQLNRSSLLRIDSTQSFVSPAYQKRTVPSKEPGKLSREGDGQPVADKARQEKVKQQVQGLKAEEQKVKAHEMAHKAVGGEYAGAIRYQYATGSDGQAYIVGGEVSIDISEGKTPEETLRKMEQVKRAAMAPADPSPQDNSVASAATRIEQKARYELMKANYEKDSPQTDKHIDTYT